MNFQQQLEDHRERTHLDFSFVAKKNVLKNLKSTTVKEPMTTKPTRNHKSAVSTSSPQLVYEDAQDFVGASQEVVVSAEDDGRFETVGEDSQQQIMIQTEDGSLLNMNNIILTENGELIIQNLDGLLPNGASGNDESGGQIHIDNLEQFLLEQGITSGEEISYIQSDGNEIISNDDETVSQHSQSGLMPHYNQIFEPDPNIPTELIESSEVQVDDGVENILMNGQYVIQSGSGYEQLVTSNGQQARVQNETQVQLDANQSTLDELGDILLEVAAAAEQEKKPRLNQHFNQGANIGSKKRGAAAISSQPKKKFGSDHAAADESEVPAANFSHAYEIFVKGFSAKRNSKM
jgi:hypothetical protein